MTRKTPSSPENGSGNKALALLIGTSCVIAAPVSFAGPAGGVVTGGEGTISTPSTTSTVIDQSSSRLSIDWQSFDVGASESVSFRQPTSNSVALNRILDQKASQVFGRIDANGRVVLFNSHGIMFGPGSQVNVGSLLATSLNVVSFDESSGQLRLSATGSPGSIINSGTLSAAPGGSVSLIGGTVSNNGLIVADLGSVNLAAGRSATLDFYGGGLLRFDADSSLVENASGAAAGVSNSGQISADGGQVLLTTSAVQNVFSRAVNNEGVVRANRIDNSGGSIRLVGAEGTVVNSGVLDASGVGAGSSGGSVQVLGKNVGLFGSSVVDVSGDAGGGVALIGGDYQGANADVLNASQTFVGPNAQIVADARVAGDGGRVILWSDDLTHFYGSISARGGADSGNGGFAEVSSHGALGFNGSVDVAAPAGVGGQLLLDPEDITIEDTGPVTDVDLDFTDDPDGNPATNPPNASIDADAVVAALTTGATAVNLRATDDIFVNEAIDVSLVPAANGRGITLRAGDNITINEAIATRNGAITITAADINTTPISQDGDGTGDLTFGANGSLNAGTAAVTLSTQGDLALRAVSGGVVSVTSREGAVTQVAATTLTSTNLTANSATGVTLGVGSTLLLNGPLSATATATGADVAIVNTGTLGNVGVSAGGDINIATTGNMTVAMITAGDNVTLSSGGSILDDHNSTAITADNVQLTAVDQIGEVTRADLANGTANFPVSINTAGNLSAAVTSAAAGAQINLELVQTPTIGAGQIVLGNGGASAGTVLLQATGDLDLAPPSPGTPPFADDAISLGAGNTAALGLRSAGTLTLPADTSRIFVDAPQTYAVDGANVVDDDGGNLAFTAGHLIFRSGAAATLDTTVGQLTAATTNQNLAVIETDDIVLNTVNLGTGALSLDVNGAITDGTATPAVVANQLTITDAASVVLDTNVATLNASGVDGQLTINEASGPLAVLNAASTGGAVSVSTTTGAMTVTDASGTNVTLGAAGALTVTGTVNANPTTGVTTLTAGGPMTLTGSTVNTRSATLTSTGAMQLGTINASLVDGTVSLQAGAAGAISDGAGVSVTADQLTIANSLSADLNTNADNLTAAVGAGGLTISEASGPLAVANASSTGGAVNVSTATGNLSVANASGTNVTLGASGALTVTGTVNANTTTGLTTLGAGGAMTLTGSTVNTRSATLTSAGAMQLGTINASLVDGTVSLQAGAAGAITDGAGVSVTADQLTIANSLSADLNTNVDNLTAAVGAGGLTITEASGPLAVANAASTGGAVNVSTATGTMSVANASGTNVTLGASGALTVTGTVNANTTTGLTTLTAGGPMTLTGSTVNTRSATLLSAGAMQLGTINGSLVDGTVALQAGAAGAISDGAGVSVTADQLTIATTQSADLNTNVDNLTATVGNGGLTITETSGPLTVVNAASVGGAVNISTTAGNLSVTAASGNNVTLNASSGGTSADSVASGNLAVTSVSTGAGGTANLTADGAITLGTVTATNGTVSLAARDGAITDAVAPNFVPSVVASTLAITDADSVNLDTNVTTLNANGVTGALTIVDRVGDLAVTNAVSTAGAVNVSTSNGNLTVANAVGNGVTLAAGGTGSVLSLATVNAGAGNATLSAAQGSITDDDDGTVSTTRIIGANVSLTAATGIGTVTDFAAAAGRSVDVETSGTLSADVTTIPTLPATAQINLNVLGAPIIAADGIRLGPIAATNRTGSVLLQSANDLNLQNLTAGAINIGTPNTVSVGYVSGGLLTLPDGGSPTDTSPFNLLVEGTDIVQGAGASRTINLTANSLVFNATNPAGAFQLNTNVSSLTADVTGGADLNVDEFTGDITLGSIVAQNFTVQADTAGGAILDDGDVSGLTTITADSVYLGSAGAIGSGAATAPGAMDVNTAEVTAFAGTGDVVVNSVGTASVRAGLFAGNAAATAGNGNVSLVAAGDVGVAALVANQDVVNVTAAGQITNDAAIPVVTANQLVIGGASAVDLAVDINTLNASGVTGNLNVTEMGGALAVTNASATGAVNVSSIAGALDVTNASGANVTLTATTNITLGTATANPTTGTVSLLAGGAIVDAAGTTPSVDANQLTITGASSVDLDTNVNILNATGLGGPLTIREQTGNLAVANATSTVGAVSVSAVSGALTNVNASGASVNLTASTNLGLNAVNAGAGTATLAAGGAITDAAGATPSVVAGTLLIANAGSADLDTNVNTLSASNIAGALTIREQTGALAVTNATATGAVNLATVAGALTATSVSGNGVTLAAGGAGNGLTLGTVNAGAGTATLAAGGAITDAVGATPSVVAGTLLIASAGSADLDTDVATLNASGVTGALSIREQTGALAVTNASAAGAVTVSTVAGALTNVNASGSNVTLTAGGANALSLGTVNANPTTGTVSLAAGGAITDAAGAAASVVANQLTITNAASADLDTNVNTLSATGVTGNLTVREQTGALAVANATAGGVVNLATVAGALTNVNASGTNVTLNAGGAGNGISLGTVNANPTTGTVLLTAPGAISDAAGAAPSVVANQLTITGAGSADLDTNVNTLNATGVTGALSIREQTSALAVANASATGAINLSTVAGDLNVTEAASSGNTLTLTAGGTGALTVAATTASGTSATLTSGGAMTLGTVNATAGAATLTSGGAMTLGTVNAGTGAATLTSGAALTLGTVNAGTTTLSAVGAITDATGATPSVVANQLTITSAGSVDLDTNVNTLNASGVTGALTVREQTGALAVTNATSAGAVNVSTVAGALTNVNATGSNVTLTAGGANALSLGTVNATTGTVSLAGGAITDAAGAAASVVANQLTITSATSADLDTNVNTLNASGVTGNLAVREQTGALAVANASATGTVNVSTVAGAMTGVTATGSGVTLNAGGAGSGLALTAVNSGTGTTTLTAGGAITDAAGATPSVVANQLTITGAGSVDLDTNVNTLTASGVTGALAVREQTGALAVTNAAAAGAVNLSTVAGALNVTSATGNGLTLTTAGAGNGITLGTVSAGTGAATITTLGALSDGTTGTALTAGTASITAGSIGSAANTIETNVASLTATSTTGGMFIRETDNIALTNLSATAANQDIVVGTTGDITVAQITNANGRVLLAGSDILAVDGTGNHITAQNVELRSGFDAAGGRIGTETDPLRLDVPQTVGGGAGGTGAPVPSVLLVRNESVGDSTQAAQDEQVDLASGTFNISNTTFDPALITAQAFTTTTFSTRTAQGNGVEVQNAQLNVNGALNTTATVGLSTRGAASVLSASGASNAQGEGTLYIDWASFDPNVSLFGTMNPPICLPRDQSDEEAEPADPAAAAASTAASGGCASSTAQIDSQSHLPEVTLVISSRGLEWVRAPSERKSQVSVMPLISQRR